MVFSDTSTNLGILQDITFKTGASTTNFPTADRTRIINNWYMKTTGWIITSNGRWQWDDSNQTNQPSATTDLVTNQRDYTVINASPTASQDWLVVAKVQIKDTGGKWIDLKSIDKREINEGNFITSGTPDYYDFDGASIKLYNATSYDSTGGLKVWFQRSPLLFTATDTTKKPGFASIFHEILSLGASYDYLLNRKKDYAGADRINVEIEKMKADLQTHYGRRNNYEVNQIRRAERKGYYK